MVTADLAELTAEKPYVVDADITIDHDVTISGDAKLIICDGKTLTINGRLNDNSSSYSSTYSLSLYGQKNETGKLDIVFMGGGTATSALKVYSLDVSGVNITITASSPGGYAIRATNELNLYHGSVDAKNYEGNYQVSADCITAFKANVYDGSTLKAFGRQVTLYCSNSVNIYGGNVTATNGYDSDGKGGKAIYSASVNIYDGFVVAQGGDAKSDQSQNGGTGIEAVTNITVNGGTLYAVGGKSGDSQTGGYGIYTQSLTVNDGEVHVNGGHGGGPSPSNGGNGMFGKVSMNGGSIEVEAGSGYSSGTMGNGIVFDSGNLDYSAGSVDIEGFRAIATTTSGDGTLTNSNASGNIIYYTRDNGNPWDSGTNLAAGASASVAKFGLKIE